MFTRRSIEYIYTGVMQYALQQVKPGFTIHGAEGVLRASDTYVSSIGAFGFTVTSTAAYSGCWVGLRKFSRMLCPPPSEGPSGATVEAAGRLSPNPSRRPLRRPKRPHSRRLAVREGRVLPRSPALGRTHNDRAPILKLGQGLFSEIATFTIESGPPRPLGALLDSSLLYRETVFPERRGHT
jgi:hypothetical protein